MILILAQDGTDAVAQAVSAAIMQQYSLPCAPEIVRPDAVWSRAVEWDDLLLVVFNSSALPAPAVEYIQAYRKAHNIGGGVIPIAVDPELHIPPEPISGIKASQCDGSPEVTAKIVQTVGVFLGLALRPGSQKIFVSYRASDGTFLAQSLHERLRAEGFDAWLDEAKENLVIGDDVQQKIHAMLEQAAMVLLVDTPDAPESKWVKVEVDLANAQLIPVLPVVAGGERTSRFIQLQGLRRWILVKQGGLDGTPLSDGEWHDVRREIYQLQLSAFQRRLKILARARKAFEHYGYIWMTVDERLRMYRCEKVINAIRRIIAFSHCLIQDITYIPAIRAWWSYLEKYPEIAAVNQKICIYDREKILSPSEIETLTESLPEMSKMNPILAHYNEIETLIASGFGA